MEHKFTPGNWFVRSMERLGEIRDCFVAAPDVNGFVYDAQILGDDEYTHDETMQRQFADCHLISAAPDMLKALEAILSSPKIYPDQKGMIVFNENLIEQAKAAVAKALHKE